LLCQNTAAVETAQETKTTQMKPKIIALALALAWTGSAAIAKPNREGWEYWPVVLPADKTTNTAAAAA
jgi:hypothetical protein